MQVVGLDVPVDDGQPVQGGEALEDAGAELGHLAAPKRWPLSRRALRVAPSCQLIR
jgi:hypothetical protein